MQKKKAISLIVLVITIIVMIILAGTIILSLSQNGIIGKANEAVDTTNLKQLQQVATLAWADAYAGGKRTQSELEKAVTDALEDIDTSKYNITVTDKGVTVTSKTTTEVTGWTQTGTTVTNGEITLTVGDYIDYEAGVEGYTDTKGWRVLGVEDGEILVVSATNVVAELTLGGSTLEEAQTSYATQAAIDLQNAVNAYGSGDKATGVRSIKGEDIDRVAEYDITSFKGQEAYDTMLNFYVSMGVPEAEAEVQLGDRTTYPIMDYGREVTFSWDTTNFPKYSYLETGATEPTTGMLLNEHATKFVWYDEQAKVWRSSTKATSGSIVDDTDTTKVATIKNNYVFYLGKDKIDPASAAYEMLIATKGEDNTEIPLTYWLASPYVGVCPFFAYFGFRAVLEGLVYDYGFVDSYGHCGSTPFGVRAVVSLASNIQLDEGAEANTWVITNKEEK